MKPEIEETKNVKLPLVEKLSRKNSQWKRAHATFDDEQRLDYKRNGYAFMNEKQLALIYDRQEQDLYALNITELGALSKEEKISRLEKDIRALAALDQDPSWQANKGALSPSVYSPETASLIILSPEILSPRIESKERMVIEVSCKKFYRRIFSVGLTAKKRCITLARPVYTVILEKVKSTNITEACHVCHYFPSYRFNFIK
ncbi:unnamed protein product [Heligmosomoides polygyrus]|uniref:Uma2 domain-containing protein n=1 Tax=Heligmosomoides polygyrus TaxID=6339 RepID=A0A3P8DDV5_HELPZ|nr:unnamed protein product [Heligmosomoides polygyrus]